MSKKELETKSVKELRAIAKELDIVGRWDMSKDELIEKIDTLTHLVSDNDEEEDWLKPVEEPVKKEVNWEEEVGVEPVDEEVVETITQKTDEEKQEKKLAYVKTAPVGVLIAFWTGNKMRTGKIDNRSIQRGVLKVITEYNKEFIVPFEDVAWVKTGKKWPTKIFKLLKGNKPYENKIRDNGFNSRIS